MRYSRAGLSITPITQAGVVDGSDRQGDLLLPARIESTVHERRHLIQTARQPA